MLCRGISNLVLAEVKGWRGPRRPHGAHMTNFHTPSAVQTLDQSQALDPTAKHSPGKLKHSKKCLYAPGRSEVCPGAGGWMVC